MDIEKKLVKLAEYITAQALIKYREQGHPTTGELEQSIQLKTKSFLSRKSVEMSMYLYGIFVDKGVIAQNVRAGELYLDAIQKWSIRKGITANMEEARSFSFAVRAKHMKHGIPIDKKRRFWLSATLDKLDDYISKELTAIAGESVETEFIKMINVIQ